MKPREQHELSTSRRPPAVHRTNKPDEAPPAPRRSLKTTTSTPPALLCVTPGPGVHREHKPAIPIIPLSYSKWSMLGVRVEDSVYHFPLVPKDGGNKIQLNVGGFGAEQPEFEWLADLVTYYTGAARCDVPFKLKDERAGLYPSLASPTRMLLDQSTDELMTSSALHSPRDATLDAIFDAVVDEMFEVSNFLLAKALATDYSFDKVPWAAGAMNRLVSDCGQLLHEIADGSAVAGSEALLDHVVDLILRPTLHLTIEECLDSAEFSVPPANDINGMAGFEPEARSTQRYAATAPPGLSTDDRFWSTDFRSIFPWYIPELNRPEVSAALTDMAIGDFIVYETPDGTDLPAYDPAKYIVEDVTPFAALEEKVKIEPRVLPKARRAKKAARVVRRGQNLGQFTDDRHLNVVVDPQTRIVLAEKKGTGTESFDMAAAMFPKRRQSSAAAAYPCPEAPSAPRVIQMVSKDAIYHDAAIGGAQPDDAIYDQAASDASRPISVGFTPRPTRFDGNQADYDANYKLMQGLGPTSPTYDRGSAPGSTDGYSATWSAPRGAARYAQPAPIARESAAVGPSATIYHQTVAEDKRSQVNPAIPQPLYQQATRTRINKQADSNYEMAAVGPSAAIYHQAVAEDKRSHVNPAIPQPLYQQATRTRINKQADSNYDLAGRDGFLSSDA